MKRFFAFGCSYTNYTWPTWADFVGVGFDEFYNYGRGGSSNTYIMNKLIESNDVNPFNSKTDTVYIMLTGIGRFSYINYINDDNLDWITRGDLINYANCTKDEVMLYFLKHIFSEEFAVYQSWIATKIIKNFLTTHNINHKIFMGISNISYLRHNPYISDNMKQKVQEIYDVCDAKLSLDEWMDANPKFKLSHYFENIKIDDGHPAMQSHYQFVQEHFPELLTRESQNLLDFWIKNFNSAGQAEQGAKFNLLFRMEKDKAMQVRLT